MYSRCLQYSVKINLQDLSPSPTSQSPAITNAQNYRMEMRVLPSERWFIILKLLLMREQNFQNFCLKQAEASKLPINFSIFFLGYQKVVKKSQVYYLRLGGLQHCQGDTAENNHSYRTFILHVQGALQSLPGNLPIYYVYFIKIWRLK